VGYGPPVVRYRLIDNAVAPDVLDKFPGPGGHRVTLSPLLSDGLNIFLGVDESHRSEQSLRDLVTKRDIGLVKANRNGIRVLNVYTFDQPKLRPQGIGRPILGDRFEGKLYILRGHLSLTIMELHALA